jgi:hypothetical protein
LWAVFRPLDFINNLLLPIHVYPAQLLHGNQWYYYRVGQPCLGAGKGAFWLMLHGLRLGLAWAQPIQRLSFSLDLSPFGDIVASAEEMNCRSKLIRDLFFI